MKKKLTKKEVELSKELDNIFEICGLNYKKIYKLDKEARKPVLRIIKDHVIRGEIVQEYTLIDEFLGTIICKYFFGKKSNFKNLWKTKKFQNFNYFVLEKLYLLNKLDMVKSFEKIPKPIEDKIKKINDIRNCIGHTFFLENRRSKPIYKGKDILSIDALNLFREDAEKVNNFLIEKAYSIKLD